MLETPQRQEWPQCRMPFLLSKEPYNHVARGFVMCNEALKGGSRGNIGGHGSARRSFCTDELYNRLKKSVFAAEQANDGLSCGTDGSRDLIQGDLVYPTL